MLITDAILQADDEHAIYFFLTSYIEAVRYCDKLNRLPDSIRELPFIGMEDVWARIVLLRSELGKPSREPDGRDHDIIREAMTLLAVALDRLVSLKEKRLREILVAA